jgi:multicomponent Na+:H+ antiporter subunit A
MKKSLTAIVVMLALLNKVAANSQEIDQLQATSPALVAIATPFVASAMILVFYRWLKDYSAYLGSLAALISFLSVFQMLGSKGAIVYDWIPSLGIQFELYVDGLSILIALLASGIGMLIFMYSRSYMSHGEGKKRYYAVLTAFMGSMIGLVLSSNMILLFLFWELTSICSFILISHHYRQESSIYASKKSLILTVGSGMALLVGFLILENVFGTFSILEILQTTDAAEKLVEEGLYIPVLGLLGLGAAAKSAQLPLHIWLPNAMEAPTPVSAFLHSATMVKAGIFLIARFRPILMPEKFWSITFIALGLSTMTVAALLAVKSSKLKELLAYSTASHLGLIVSGFGFESVLGAETGVFHILNHAVFKASLFMIAGVVLHEAGTQKIKELSGLRHQWPLLTIIATISALSMAGIPPLNGFYSKEMLFESAYHLASQYGGITWIVPTVAVLGSVFTLVYSLRFISVFYGDLEKKLHEIPPLMILPPALLTFIVVAIGLTPQIFVDKLVNPAILSTAPGAHGLSVHLPTSLKPAVLMSGITIILGLAAYKKQAAIQNIVDSVLAIPYLTSNYYYHGFLDLSDLASEKMVEITDTGLLRTYSIWTIVMASVLGLSGYLVALPIPEASISSPLPVIIILATAVTSVYAVIKARTYIAAVLTLSILGFMVSIYYLLLDAPDLVMTQLVVETLSLIIFLLVLDKLPELQKKVSITRKFRDILVASLAGLLAFVSVIYSTMEPTPGEVSEYYLNHALPGSGGTNVVNVILVDFRGIDTMGEISVIAMAGIAILMLFKMRGEKQ